MKALKRQQETQNAIMEENEKVHEAQLAAAEQTVIEDIIKIVKEEE